MRKRKKGGGYINIGKEENIKDLKSLRFSSGLSGYGDKQILTLNLKLAGII